MACRENLGRGHQNGNRKSSYDHTCKGWAFFTAIAKQTVSVAEANGRPTKALCFESV